MVDAGPEPMYEEKMRVPPPPSRDLSISSNISLLNAYKWAFVLVGFCPSGLLSWWAFVQWAFVLVGFCPSGLLSYTHAHRCCLSGYPLSHDVRNGTVLNRNINSHVYYDKTYTC